MEDKELLNEIYKIVEEAPELTMINDDPVDEEKLNNAMQAIWQLLQKRKK